ncbi:O-antigen ligase family protein [Clostridium algidicarnis]|uniref:O-antigen ligase family protein n=1 Tax=Clostridium algidicarnis TaxID=37659 RepID=UPI001C0DAAE6|nr:O-antigen ligase family protein [Clostridium algidicarnis]MBU3205210.1 O-antigen ligase family protein [Clostridium algidicarnis]MBU3213363.1 O-antigen ligase family protein [Clostridium algidicarnis]MBU3223306.1 O-antigen ligase family protein [Clostridium algidicarnis]
MNREENKYLKINNIKITKAFIEWIIIILFFVFSFMSSTTLLISLVMLLILLKQKEIGCIKILNIITLRTIINPGIAIGISKYQSFKWIIIFGCSIYLQLSYFKLDKINKNKINILIKPIILFTIYNLLVALFFSSLPIVASFKIISYIIVFIGIIIGIGYTYKEVNWINWMFTLLILLLLTSALFLNLPVGYLRNGHAFQGITNHPNIFGVVMSIFIAILFTKMQSKSINRKSIQIILLFFSIYEAYLSKSRTSMITILFLVIMYLLFSNIKSIYKILYLNLISVLTVLFFYIDNPIRDMFKSFLFKGNEDILYSRINQVDNLKDNFLANPLFGSGFAVPVLPFKSYKFSFDYIVEPGNLILAVLSYSGVIGFAIFSYYMFKIFWINKKEFRNVGFLFIVSIMISMGEMVFFSSNNIGIWCYMMLGMYVFFDKGNLKS